MCMCGCDNPEHDPSVPYSEFEISPPQGQKRPMRKLHEPYGGGIRRRLEFDDEDEEYRHTPASLHRPHDPRGSIYAPNYLSPKLVPAGPLRGIGQRPDLAEMSGVAIVRRRLDFEDVSDIEDEEEAPEECPPAPPARAAAPPRRPICPMRPVPATREQVPRATRITQGGRKCLRM